jgi:hypothetical protein
MVKNDEVCLDFVNGFENKGSNLFSEVDDYGRLALFSYGQHFPLCVKLLDGFLVNINSYSMTTSQHQGHLARALGFSNLKELKLNPKSNIVLMNTEKLQNIKYLDIKSLTDLTEKEI